MAAPRPESAISPGHILGNYRVHASPSGGTAILGSGAYGTTYLADHIHLQTPAALKILHAAPTDAGPSDQGGARFLEEARAASRLDHPHIARVLDFGTTPEGQAYYAIEFCGGGSLQELVESSGPLPPGEVFEVATQIASALAAAHTAGIVHHDIKPSNLMLAHHPGGTRVKLIDFGLAGQLESPGSAENRAPAGTPGFASPEQLSGSTPDPRSDIFSLGATLYWLLTGNPLDTGDARTVARARIAAKSYDSALEEADLPPPLTEFLAHLLATDPTRRPASGTALTPLLQPPALAALRQPLPPVPEAPPTSTPAAPAPTWTTPTAPARWQDHFTPSPPGSDPAPPGEPTPAHHTATGTHHTLYLFPPGHPAPDTLLSRLTTAPAGTTVPLAPAHLIRYPDGTAAAALPAPGGPDGTSIDLLTALRTSGLYQLGEHSAWLEALAAVLDHLEGSGIGITFSPAAFTLASGPEEQLQIFPHLTLHDPASSENSPAPQDASTTLVHDDAATYAGSFAGLIYHLVGGRALPQGAHFSSRAYSPVPQLSEAGNRLLATVAASEHSGGAPAGNSRAFFASLLASEGLRSLGASISRSTFLTGGSSRSRSATTTASVGAPPPPPPPPPGPPAPPVAKPAPTPAPQKKSLPLPAIIGGLLLLLAAGAATFFLLLPKKEAPPITTTLPAPQATAPVPKAPSSTLHITPGPATLATALAQAKAGATIHLAPGTYPGSHVITRPITLIGQSQVTLTPAPGETSTLTARGDTHLTLKNLRIQSTATTTRAAPLILIDAATLTAESLTITGSITDGLEITNKGTATLSDSTLSSNEGHGLHLRAGSTATATRTLFERNGSAGALASTRSTLTLNTSCHLKENGTSGLHLADGATAALSDTRLTSNTTSGITLSGAGTTLTITSGEISGNRTSGILANGGQITLTGTTLSRNLEHGIALARTTLTTSITSGIFDANGLTGIFADQPAGSTTPLTITTSTFRGHSNAGLAAVGGHLQLTASTFEGNELAILLSGTLTGTLKNNTITLRGTQEGIITEAGANAAQENNTITRE